MDCSEPIDGNPPTRRCCVLLLHVEKDLMRDKVAALIGCGGINTSSIYHATATKVRIRGRGSMHKEEAHCDCGIPRHKTKKGRNQNPYDASCECKAKELFWTGEANIPLQMALSAPGPRRLEQALRMARSLLDHHNVRYEVTDVRGPQHELSRLQRMCIFDMVPDEWKPVINPAAGLRTGFHSQACWVPASPSVAWPSCGAGACHREAVWGGSSTPYWGHQEQHNLSWPQWHEEAWACYERSDGCATQSASHADDIELKTSDLIRQAVVAYLCCEDQEEAPWSTW